ncbi:MAG: hypothetical protein V1872_14610 [bacterium]
MSFAVQYQYDNYWGSLNPYIPGFSNDSQTIEIALDEISEHNSQSISLSRTEIIDQLIEVYKECSECDWDGYGASPIRKESILGAYKFISLLPSSIPVPEITVEPNGIVAFEWHKDKHQVFVASMNNRKKISYAGILGPNRAYGVEYFGESIPQIVIEHIKRLYYKD